MALVALGLHVSPALAADENLGTALNTATSDTASSFWTLLKGAAILPLGLILLFSGLVQLQQAGASGAQTGGMGRWAFGDYGDAIMRLLAGAAMLALPSFIDIINQTFAIDSAVGANGLQITAGNMGDGGGSGLIGMLGRFFAVASGPLSSFALAGAFLIGVGLMIKGLFDASRLSDQNNHSRGGVGGVVATLAVGAMLTNLPTLISIVSRTFGLEGLSQSDFLAAGTNAAASMRSYAAAADQMASGADAFNQAYESVVYMIGYGLLPFGLIAFIRGLIIFRRVADGNPRGESVGMGVTHIIGGAMLTNAVLVVCLVDATFTTVSQPFC